MMIARTRCNAVETVASLFVFTFIVLLAALVGDAALVSTTMAVGFETKLIQATVGGFANLMGVGATGDRLAALPPITIVLKGAIFEDVTAAPDTQAPIQLKIMI